MCLPQGLDFPSYSPTQEQVDHTHFTPRSTKDRLRGHLMARYYAAKSIVHRPFLYQVLHNDHISVLSDAEKNGARTAVGSAFMSCVHSGILHEPITLLLHPINSCRR